jgi:hypothetical protein
MKSNTKGYGGKTHYTDSQNSDTTASSGRELYHLQFSLQAASPETYGYLRTLRLYYNEEKIFLLRPRHRREDNIKKMLKIMLAFVE